MPYIIDRLLDLLNSNFLTSVLSSSLGAVGGAQAIKIVEASNKRQKDLAIINGDLVLMSNTLSKLINLKKTIIPMYKETIHLKNGTSQDKDFSLQQALTTIVAPKLISLERVFGFVYAYATTHYIAVVMCGKGMESLEELSHVLEQRNKTLSAEIYHDNLDMLEHLYELTEALNIKIDESLFYTYYTFKEFRHLALKIMPKRFHKDILDLEIEESEEKIIPAYNFIQGYYNRPLD